MRRASALAVLVVALSFTDCRGRTTAPDPVVAVDAGAAAAPSIDAGKVLALIGEHAPSVAVGVEQRGADVALDIKGAGPPEVALVMLGSLDARVPGLRATKLGFDADAWRATLVTNGAAAETPDALADVLAAVKPAFAGGALFAVADVEVQGGGARLSFRGTLARQRTIADAAGVVPSGYTLAKVDAGPPFVLEVARVP